MPSLVKRPASDQFGTPYPFPRIPDHTNVHLLAAATNEADTPPAGARTVMISANLTIYIRLNTAAAAPAADVVDGTGSVYIAPGTVREFALDRVSTINMIGIGAETPIVTLSYYN